MDVYVGKVEGWCWQFSLRQVSVGSVVCAAQESELCSEKGEMRPCLCLTSTDIV